DGDPHRHPRQPEPVGRRGADRVRGEPSVRGHASHRRPRGDHPAAVLRAGMGLGQAVRNRSGGAALVLGRRRGGAGAGRLALLSAAALVTHFFAGFLVAPEALWLLWRLRSRAVVIAVGAVAGVQLAMLPFAATDSSTPYGAGWIASHPLIGRIATTAIEWGA